MSEIPEWKRREDEKRKRLGWVWEMYARAVSSGPSYESEWCDYARKVHRFIEELCGHLTQAFDDLQWAMERIEELDERLASFEGKLEPRRAREERDKWIYKSVCDVDRGLDAIRFELRELCGKNNWPNTIGSNEGVRKAALRHAKALGLPLPPTRRG